MRTSEFLPYVVFIDAPEFEVLKSMNRAGIEAGVVSKELTVRASVLFHDALAFYLRPKDIPV